MIHTYLLFFCGRQVKMLYIYALSWCKSESLIDVYLSPNAVSGLAVLRYLRLSQPQLDVLQALAEQAGLLRPGRLSAVQDGVEELSVFPSQRLQTLHHRFSVEHDLVLRQTLQRLFSWVHHGGHHPRDAPLAENRP